jgi:hypothetical protein
MAHHRGEALPVVRRLRRGRALPLREMRLRPARRGWQWFQVKGMWTDVPHRQGAFIGVSPVWQLGGTRVQLDHLAKLPVPAQPPPLVTLVRRGDERDVRAVVSGADFAPEGTGLGAQIRCQRRQGREVGGGDNGNSPAAIREPGTGNISHQAVTSSKGAPGSPGAAASERLIYPSRRSEDRSAPHDHGTTSV